MGFYTDEGIHARDETLRALLHMNNDHLRQFRTIEDLLGSVIYWPAFLREMFFSSHLRFNDRFKLTLFLLGNALPPTLIVEWYITRKMLKDDSARRNVADLIKKHMTGELEQRGYLVYMLDATTCKPYVLREHKWDGVGDPDVNRLRVPRCQTLHTRSRRCCD